MNIKIGLIIYARLSSSRLKEKALLNLNESNILSNVVNICKNINVEIVLATSTREEDDALELIAKSCKVKCFRGDLNDVAKRTIDCLISYKFDYFIRVNGDSLFVPYELINQYIGTQLYNFDIVTNVMNRTFPYGYSVEIIKSETFINCYKFFNDSEKEHITSYFYSNKQSFNIYNIILPEKVRFFVNTSLTIDILEDYELINEMFNIDKFIQYKNLEEIVSLNNIVKNKIK
jgi:spore coat polysaccharide biosynthesis protein SpsF